MYIYLVSSLSTNLFKNTLANFTNKLARVLELPVSERWGIAVEYISLSETFAGDYSTDTIKINCPIIKQTISTASQERCLATFAYNKDELSSSYFHEFIDKNYFPIENSYVDRISINLTDLEGKTIILRHGHPTIIKLHLKKMSGEEFTILCDSGKTELHPNNKANEFTVQLHKELVLYDDWEVAITSITHPPPKTAIFSEPQFLFWKAPGDEPTGFYEVSPYFTNIKQLLYSFLTGVDIKSDGKVHFIWNPRTKKILMNLQEPHYISMTEELALVFQVHESRFLCERGVLEKYANTLPGVATLSQEEIDKCVLLPVGYRDFTDRIDFDFRALRYLLVFSDFTDQCIVGDANVRIIKIIPLTQYDENDKSTINFWMHEYHKVSNSSLKFLSFNIHANGGKDLLFGGDEILSLSLKFRKIKK
jgi:hypothetical protein